MTVELTVASKGSWWRDAYISQPGTIYYNEPIMVLPPGIEVVRSWCDVATQKLKLEVRSG